MGGKSSTPDQKSVNTLEKTTIDIAITGMTGAGKSSLVNALRGLSDYDEEAAKTGVTEGTTEPTPYPHPSFPDITIWDLPGIGTPNFKAEEYLERVNYSQYDFFLIVASDLFTVYDLQLSHAIQKMEKRFYYVRSRMDVSIENEKLKPDFNKEATTQNVRKYCLENLVRAGVSSPQIFLISNWYRETYDFPLLQRTLENEIDQLRRCILRPAVLQESEKRRRDRSSSESKEEEGRLTEMVATAVEGHNKLGESTLDIAITGVSGAGKSSLVNTLRGLSDFDEEAAQTDVIEGTTEPTPYPHPTFSDVTIWDLPGIGTPRFKAEEYLERVNYSKYDFFIIVASNRFTHYDIQLSHAIQKMKRRFYYVRSKMDESIKNEKVKPDFREEAVIQKVRKYCLENLEQAGFSSPEIFLISSWYQDKYDFPLLQRTLENEINHLERASSLAEKQKHNRSTEPAQSFGRHVVYIMKSMLTYELSKLKYVIMQKSLEEVSAEIHQELAALENACLNIAITGDSGAGKSSLVNALRGMTDYEEGAAKVGITQTTMKPHPYTHPLFPKVTLWDLPGIGTPDFTPKDYLNKVNFSQYDFFIIVASERFTENDVLLAREIRKRKKHFYYVRSRMDVSIAAETRDPNFDMDKTIEELRKYCCENLIKAGECSPMVFLISNRDLSMYDFPLLQEALEYDLDDMKKHAFIASLPVFSKKMIKKKKTTMEKRIWKIAFLSCNIGIIAIPLFPLVCDLPILVDSMKLFCKGFGLDEDSLRRVAKLVGKDYEVLKSAVKKSPMFSEVTPEFVSRLLEQSWLCSTVSSTQRVLDFIPVLGNLTGGAGSFLTTFCMLKSFLRDVVEDAENVWAKAFEP